MSFVEMVSKKYYKKHKKLDIVIPPWFAKENMDNMLRKKVSKYYPNIIIVEKDKKPIIVSDGDYYDNTLTFRCDILPVANKLMMQLMSNSIDDILLTGDQSITDALSCCPKKNIFYQIAPWKSDLAKNLAKDMPNTNLKKVSTSCGSLGAIRYKSNYSAFIKKWAFRNRAKGKLDAIILSINAMKKDLNINGLAHIVTTSKTIPSIKRKLRDEIHESQPKKKSNGRCHSKRRRKSLRKSRRKHKKRCAHGFKKSGGCKKKPGPKSRKRCAHGIKKSGGCKKKPGPKSRKRRSKK
tara:strand:- start:252 stop:1133 length:882 start_codon:yes stop_codon:yes gene_type:complete